MSEFNLEKRTPDSMQDFYAEKILLLEQQLAEKSAAIQLYTKALDDHIEKINEKEARIKELECELGIEFGRVASLRNTVESLQSQVGKGEK